MLGDWVDEETCIGQAESLGNLKKGHGDGDKLCVSRDGVMQEGTGEVFNVFYVRGSVKEVWSMSRALQEGEEIMKVYCHELCTECIHGFPYEVDYLGVVECEGGGQVQCSVER